MSDKKYKLQEEKIKTLQNEYLQTGQDKGYFILDSNKIKYLASGKNIIFDKDDRKMRKLNKDYH